VPLEVVPGGTHGQSGPGTPDDAGAPGSAGRSGRSRRSGAAGTTGAAAAAAAAGGPIGVRSSAHRRGATRRVGTAGRLAAFHLLVLGLVLGVVVVALVHQFSTSYEQIAGQSLASELKEFSSSLPASAASGSASRTAACVLATSATRYFRGHELPAGTVLAVGIPSCPRTNSRVVASGAVTLIGPVLGNPAVRLALAAPPEASSVRPVTVGGHQMEVLTAPILAHGRVVGSFVAATDLTPFLADRSRVLWLSIAEAGVALLAGVASVFFLLRRLLRTVGRITTAAEEIEKGEIDRRLGDQGTDDEVGHLADTFDRMLERIATAMTSQRRLLSDVSHQLRTPLTVARGHLEILQRTGMGDPAAVDETVVLVVDELDHMRALVERLLLLGRAMEPDFLAPAPIDLRSLLADLHAAARVLAERGFVLAPVPDVVVHADEAKLRGAILNLVDNAVKATGPGDSIEISARLDPASGDLLIAVDDSGPGIEPAERAAALTRFERPGAEDAGGTGLGLAIVKAVAEAHGGGIDITDSPLGGCRVIVRLPARILGMDETDDVADVWGA
jgi:signal transduction histidine kinase